MTRRCIVTLEPELLRQTLGLPEGAVIERVDTSDRLGVLRLHVSGAGEECDEGRVPVPASVVVHAPEGKTPERRLSVQDPSEYWRKALEGWPVEAKAPRRPLALCVLPWATVCRGWRFVRRMP